ncbi:hypothetical protein BDM02DRAFT_3200337 [Thelephora ganbajun]|uniref:Uncharacterized protein n=1 Tax=Thelephora ganbajun TaxID=370292 RepID=A0ACB6ZR25_THEGA|nr:hypothetical protein BDM02DRAFT_3200337 [Thelephora ganbajun]
MSSSPANTSPRRRAMIADERSSFFRSWNATTIAHARGTCIHPYPPPSSVFTRANTAENSDEDFSDLGVNDFVLSHKVTARRKLECLQGSVFARSLLERGTYHAMEGIEVYNGPIEVSMGYTSCVGVMLAEEMALTNDLVGAVSVTTRGTVARVSELEETVRGLETIVRRLKRSHESLRVYMEMELANRDLTIGLLRARINSVAPMEIDLTTVEDEEEYISAPGTPPTSGHTSTTNVSIRVKTPDLVIPEGVLIPIEDSSEEDGEGEVMVPDEIDAPEPVGIILPHNTFNWQDERAQGQEEYYHRQREEEENARQEPEFVPPPSYDVIFPDVVAADRERDQNRKRHIRFICKLDTERVIEKVQGFPIGGSRIRLSWGCSQCRNDAKSLPSASGPDFIATHVMQQQTHPTITGEQAIEIFQKLGLANLLCNVRIVQVMGE